MSEPVIIGVDRGKEPCRDAVVIRRAGHTIVHDLPPGASVCFLRNDPAIAVVVHPGAPPYRLFADGSTRKLVPASSLQSM